MRDGYRIYTYEESRALIGKKVHWRTTEDHRGAVAEENEGVGEVCNPGALTNMWCFTYRVRNSAQVDTLYRVFDHVEIKLAEEGTPTSIRPKF
jgi:hypothetical protein